MAVGATSGGEIWRINGEEMKAFKYLGVWFATGMHGNVYVQLVKRQRNGQGRQNV